MKNKGGMIMAEVKEFNMMELKSYKEKRNEFLKSIQPKLQVIDVQRPTYKASKDARAKSQEKQRRSTRKRLLKKVGALAAITATSIVVGTSAVNKVYEEQISSKKQITLEDALKNGKTAEDLGIKEETIQEIHNLKSEIEDESLSYEEMLEIARKLPMIEKEVMKEKIAMAIGVEMHNIKFVAPTKDVPVCSVAVKGKGNYSRKNAINQMTGKTVSPDIIEYIEDIIEAQDMKDSLNAGTVGIKEAKEFYKSAIEKTKQVAAWEVNADEKENITVEKTKILDLEQDDELEH